MEWKHTREMWDMMQEFRRELPPQKKVEEALVELFAYPRFAIGTALICGGAAVADLASAARTRLRGGQ
ncbi:hypothetical protein AUJ46_05620 [Candidatus Peregrinibacteria bacterium CG1_02_54_53]|nr:MAG: hypothetical protein AUJ46_05620 [Candidatus Peregrinibacteria bacterium CG1_02_54_53]